MLLFGFSLGVIPAKRSAERESRSNVTGQAAALDSWFPARACGASGMTALSLRPYFKVFPVCQIPEDETRTT
ncbi:MAG: hypothetical protein JWO28_2092 [Hyphomicrobiales bacterium]|nr:hypothetical protein [Hyphomicrobiales bacterium]